MKMFWVVVILFMFYGLGVIWGTNHPLTGERPFPSASVSIPNFTGEELFNAVNNYRTSKGLKELETTEALCNNITQRYFDLTAPENENVAHAGFGEWHRKYNANWSVGEIYAYGITPEEVISKWVTSPSHDLILENPTYVYGCAYADGGDSVVEMGFPIK